MFKVQEELIKNRFCIFFFSDTDLSPPISQKKISKSFNSFRTGTSVPFDLESDLFTQSKPPPFCYVIKQYPVIDLYINPLLIVYLFIQFFITIPFRGKESRQTHDLVRWSGYLKENKKKIISNDLFDFLFPCDAQNNNRLIKFYKLI